MTEIIEMFWGCLSCQKNDNHGRFKECEGCGAPRTAGSPESMPEDIDAAPAVSDPELLRKFRAGEDWKCRYCRSSVFRADGSCAACGSPQKDSVSPTIAPVADVTEPPPPPSRLPHNLNRSPLTIPIVACTITLLGLLAWALFHTRTYDVTVSQVSWKATVSIERYAIRAHESFVEGIPGNAISRVSMGTRHHHDEQVFDHYEVVPYTERGPDGYRTESYSASESCGQTCTSTPRHCTSNKNGSATCTGGGERCSTRYCSVTKTRQVQVYRDVTRYRRESRYRDEPRYATWYGWSAWEWGHDHDVVQSALTTKVVWPGPDRTTLALSSGEQQREKRSVQLLVAFQSSDDRFEYTPKTEAELARFPSGSRHRIRKSAVSGVEIIDQ